MIKSDITLLDLIYKYPQTEKLFRKYEEITNSCIMCEHLFATLDEVSLILNCSIDELLKEVKDIIDSDVKVMQEEGGI